MTNIGNRLSTMKTASNQSTTCQRSNIQPSPLSQSDAVEKPYESALNNLINDPTIRKV